ncbi:serine/threonine protein kinase [Coprinopsis cinerea okayama7|uniref:Serine/threonine protein kinase n=1 Tax=Coprinopsis cinerea (strain Okayama-7 / 130 / ATCC MYA-4618 / FGSC 9003) TaxID=240176 RepID=A8NQR2_COPC7|nr:serine/threonine protein kinase [Coprinopsis cinerea okayama7\|eukprot:XP_001835659.2 serine/threonine protein kinase [Coprinopsis cinerea okayama7\
MAPETQGDAFPVFEGYEILARLKSVIKKVGSFLYWAGWRLKDDEAYHVLELCSGGNLENYLSQTQHALATHQFRLLLQGTANALVYLQGQGILHRNIQPSSIYVAEDDRFRYTYAADVWSLGRVLLFASSRQVHSKEAALCTVNSDWSDLLETVEAPSLISGMLKEIQEYSWSWKVMGILDRSLESALDQSKPALNCDSQLEKLLGSVNDAFLCDETGDDPLASSGELNFSFSTGDSCESSSDESIDGALQDYPPSQNDLHISLQNNGQSAGELLLWSPDFVPSILTPKIYPFSAGTIQILQSRYLLIEGRSGHHRPLLVDPTGTFVKVLDLDYSPADIDNHDLEIERTAANTISNLPGVLVAQYEAARTYLEELKSRTPMLIMHVVEGKCMLMCNSPLPDVEILVRSSTSRGSVRMLRVRFLRRSGTIEFAQRETSDCRAEWQKKVCSCQNVLPVVGPDEEQDLDDMERRALKLLRDFIRVCDVVEKGCVNRNQ